LSNQVFDIIQKAFDQLPLAAVVNDRVLVRRTV